MDGSVAVLDLKVPNNCPLQETDFAKAWTDILMATVPYFLCVLA